jgi:hypothetical protein
VFASLKTWLTETHHGISTQHLQAYLNEFTFRFNRDSIRSTPSALYSASLVKPPRGLNEALYRFSGEWRYLRCRGDG